MALNLLDELIIIGEFNGWTENLLDKEGKVKKHGNFDCSNGFNYYDTQFAIDDFGVILGGTIIARIDKNNNVYFYDLDNIREVGYMDVKEFNPSGSETTPLMTKSLSHAKPIVNTNSMQNSKEDAAYNIGKINKKWNIDSAPDDKLPRMYVQDVKNHNVPDNNISHPDTTVKNKEKYEYLIDFKEKKGNNRSHTIKNNNLRLAGYQPFDNKISHSKTDVNNNSMQNSIKVVKINTSNHIDTMYGKDEFFDHMQEILDNDAVLYISKDGKDKLFNSKNLRLNSDSKLQLLARLDNLRFDTIIHKSRNVVNTNSMQNSIKDAEIEAKSKQSTLSATKTATGTKASETLSYSETVTKNKTPKIFKGARRQLPAGLNILGFNHIIHKSRNVVNNNSMQNSKKDEDIDKKSKQKSAGTLTYTETVTKNRLQVVLSILIPMANMQHT